MTTDTDVTTTELSEAECWRLLQAHESGRIAVVQDGGPAIFPIGYRIAPGGIVLRTRAGSKLMSILLDGRIALEIDGVEEDRGWSVLVSGWAEEIDEDEAEHTTAPVSPFAGDGAHALVRITPIRVTGRSLHRV